jgi:hypothetical protein
VSAPNEAGAKYLVVGGFAIIQHGFARATEHIDLLKKKQTDGIRCSFSGKEHFQRQLF